MSQENFRSGFVTIIGLPNAGKSTFLNHIIQQKVAIVSSKPQTTRSLIQGVRTREDYQIVFVDTPGVQTPRNKLGETMARSVKSSLVDVDAIIVMVDILMGMRAKERELIASVSGRAPIVLCLNKVDLADRQRVLETIEQASRLGGIDEIIPISAQTGDNTEAVVQVLQQYLTPGPKYYPDDMVTDQPERVIAGEIIREKALQLLHEELPHGIGVEVNKIEDEGERIYMMATIYAEKDSHKGMIIGKRGAMIKQLGIRARKDLQILFDKQVYLELYVKVVKDWRNRACALRDLGLMDK